MQNSLITRSSVISSLFVIFLSALFIPFMSIAFAKSESEQFSLLNYDDEKAYIILSTSTASGDTVLTKVLLKVVSQDNNFDELLISEVRGYATTALEAVIDEDGTVTIVDQRIQPDFTITILTKRLTNNESNTNSVALSINLTKRSDNNGANIILESGLHVKKDSEILETFKIHFQRFVKSYIKNE